MRYDWSTSINIRGDITCLWMCTFDHKDYPYWNEIFNTSISSLILHNKTCKYMQADYLSQQAVIIPMRDKDITYLYFLRFNIDKLLLRFNRHFFSARKCHLFVFWDKHILHALIKSKINQYHLKSNVKHNLWK